MANRYKITPASGWQGGLSSMNFQQLRYVRAAVNNDLNLTKVASQVFTSQSGVSKQIKELEAQLQIEIFVRRGKRLTSLTEAGRAVVEVIERLLQEADNLRKISEQFARADHGRLIIASTHNQANYVLPQVLLQFSRDFPHVEVELRQGAAREIIETCCAVRQISGLRPRRWMITRSYALCRASPGAMWWWCRRITRWRAAPA
jgi:DNA-binding transcriptional LysR family regulator